MGDKKVKRISVRVPYSFKSKCHERGIPISHVCRTALLQALHQAENVTVEAKKFKSLYQATSFFNELLDARVRTITPNLEQELKEKTYKTTLFKVILASQSSSRELISLAEFLDQGEFAEEVLQGAYR